MTQIINEKLGAWLFVKGNTREKLADGLGITKLTLARRLVGDSAWKWAEVVRISEVTGVSLDELAGK